MKERERNFILMEFKSKLQTVNKWEQTTSSLGQLRTKQKSEKEADRGIKGKRERKGVQNSNSYNDWHMQDMIKIHVV